MAFGSRAHRLRLGESVVGPLIGALCALILAYVFIHKGIGLAVAPVALLIAVLLMTNLSAAVSASIFLILVVPSTVFFGLPQLGVARVALLLPAGALLLRAPFRPRFAAADAAIVGFAALVTVSSLLDGSSLRLLLLTLVPLAFYGLGRLLGARETVVAALWAITIAAPLGALTVIYEYVYVHHPLFSDPSDYSWNSSDVTLFRPGGVYLSPPGASVMLAMATPPMLAMAWINRGRRRAAVVVGLAIVVTGVAVTFTRGGYISLLAACTGFCLLAFSGSARRRFMFFAAAAAVAVVVLIPTWSSTAWFQEGVARGGTFAARQGYWQLAFPLIGDPPSALIFGHGFNSLLLARPELGGHAIAGVVAASPDLITHGAHNQYILTLLETGIVGLLLFLAWLVLPLARGIRKSIQSQDRWTRAVAAALAMSVLAFMVMSLVGDLLRYVPGVVFIALITGMLQSFTQSAPKGTQGDDPTPRANLAR